MPLVRIRFWANGEEMAEQEVWSGDESIEANGEQARQFYVWAAICRFLNAGGNLALLAHQMARIPEAWRQVQWAQGMVLLQTSQEPCGETLWTEHVFVNPENQKVLIFTEDVGVTHTDVTELLTWLREDETVYPKLLIRETNMLEGLLHAEETGEGDSAAQAEAVGGSGLSSLDG